MNRWLVRHLMYPLHERAKGQKTLQAFRRIAGNPDLPVERLDRLRLAALRDIVSHAYNNSPFYRRRFDQAGVAPPDLDSFEDLARFPLMTKKDVQADLEDLRTLPSSSESALVKSFTGGSTGQPVRFYSDRAQIANSWATCWRARSWWGLDWGDRWLWLWGSPIELSAQDWIKRVRDYLLNRKIMSAYDMTPDRMQAYCHEILRSRPRYLYSYASAAFYLAGYAREQRIDLTEAGLRVVFTTADTLYPNMREAISSTFGCPVAVEYGSRENGFVAHECPAGGLHIHADRVHLEIIKGDRPAGDGEKGEIVLTLLDARGMPLIRYRTGDVGALAAEPCSCGRNLPLLESIEGRCGDFLLAPGDRLIHHHAFCTLIEKMEDIAEYRIYQNRVDALRIEIVERSPDSGFPVDVLQRNIDLLFGCHVELSTNFVRRLDPIPSGKRRVVISELTGRYFEENRGS